VRSEEGEGRDGEGLAGVDGIEVMVCQQFDSCGGTLRSYAGLD
jgi:hypothetical protein